MENTFLLWASRQLLKMVSATLVGGGATMMASESLTRVFNERERTERKLAFTAVARGRWTPRDARTEHGIVYQTCDFTAELYADAEVGGPPTICISQNQVSPDEFC